MGEIVKLDTEIEGLKSIAYEYDINGNSFSWKGNVNKLFLVPDPKQIGSREEYSLLIEEKDRANYLKEFNKTLSDGETLNVSYNIVLPDKTSARASDTASIVDGKEGKFLVGVITLQKSNLNDRNLAYFDNTAFISTLNKLIEEAVENKSDGYLLRIAIKNINTFLSWHGETSVDKIMTDLRANIVKFVGDNSLVVRIGIDEFGAIISEAGNDKIHQVVNKIHHDIKSYRSPELEEHLRLDARIGSVYFPKYTEEPSGAMSKSYIALQAAKDSQKNFYCDYSDAAEEQEFSKEQIKIMYYMKDVVNQDKFCLAYQPIVESHTGKVASYECLLRVKDDEGKVSTAWPIIHIAEKTGFIDIVDNFVLETIVTELKAYKDMELTFNVSNITTDSPKWLASCTKHFSDHDIAKRVTVEITETAAERDLKQTAYFVASLQALGCKVALDDFGAGYTSFRQLKSLSLDMVKIDGMFILDLAENSENLLFIKTLIDFNQCYGLETIAECVESGEVAKLLMDLDVEYMQGYYFGVPNIDPPWRNE